MFWVSLLWKSLYNQAGARFAQHLTTTGSRISMWRSAVRTAGSNIRYTQESRFIFWIMLFSVCCFFPFFFFVIKGTQRFLFNDYCFQIQYHFCLPTVILRFSKLHENNNYRKIKKIQKPLIIDLKKRLKDPAVVRDQQFRKHCRKN